MIPLQIVSMESLERELSLVRGAAAGSLAGVFGPRSITWQVNREAATFLGAGRALLLQLAHPWVAAAVEQHSDTFANPIGRFHRTFGTVFTMVFGTLGQSFEAARRLPRRHASITGTLPSAAGAFPAGSFYCANQVSALRWVHATLAETAIMAYALVLPALARATRALLRRKPPVRRLVRPSERTSRARLDGFCRLHRGDDPIEHIDRHRAGARHGAPAARGRGYMAAHSSLVPGLDRGAASTAVTRRVRTALWQGGSGRRAAFYPAGSTDLSTLARSASLCGSLSGGRTAACGKNAAGLRRTMCNRFWMGQSALARPT
jgi:hypothetical protein